MPGSFWKVEESRTCDDALMLEDGAFSRMFCCASAVLTVKLVHLIKCPQTPPNLCAWALPGGPPASRLGSSLLEVGAMSLDKAQQSPRGWDVLDGARRHRERRGRVCVAGSRDGPGFGAPHSSSKRLICR